MNGSDYEVEFGREPGFPVAVGLDGFPPFVHLRAGQGFALSYHPVVTERVGLAGTDVGKQRIAQAILQLQPACQLLLVADV